jgi:hypothetical protein
VDSYLLVYLKNGPQRPGRVTVDDVDVMGVPVALGLALSQLYRSRRSAPVLQVAFYRLP